jgi:hypothetical protein
MRILPHAVPLINPSCYPTPIPASAFNMTDYGMGFFLEDKTGELTGSEFVDLNDRMRLVYRCSARDSSHTAYMIYDATTSSGASRPLIALDFGPNNQLGTISFGPTSSTEMKKYLSKLSPFGRYVVSF